MDLIPYIIGAVLALIGAGGAWLLGRFKSESDHDEEKHSAPISPAPQPIEDPDERQTPKPPRPDPARLPDDDPDALDQLSSWGDELLDE